MIDNSYDFVNQNVKSEINATIIQKSIGTRRQLRFSRILETTQMKWPKEFRRGYNREKILAELKAITKLRAAKLLNLKIRQRFWVMNFYNSFERNLNTLIKW